MSSLDRDEKLGVKMNCPATEGWPVTEELDIPPVYEQDRPEQADYETEVLVIGGGFAGLSAACTAKEAGKSVMLVDKGRPGYSGMSPWICCTAHFDAERGDNAEELMKMVRYAGENIGNDVWMRCWIEESKGIYQRMKDWGMLEQYPRAADDGFWDNFDTAGYRKKYSSKDRHRRFMGVLKEKGIPVLERTMMTNLVIRGGRCIGAMGFQVTTGQVISVSARAVILCTGNGSIMPQGFPTGANTFDGEYMAYQAGLPITGKEFEDYHGTQAYAGGSPFNTTCWSYLENVWITGGGSGEGKFNGNDGREFAMVQAGHKMELPQFGDQGLAYIENPVKRHPAPKDASPFGIAGAKNYGVDPAEIRSGKLGSGSVKDASPIGAPGMCLHLCSGVFTGFGETDCATAVPGLYVAGDGTHATGFQGGNYSSFNGMTSGMVSIDGNHAARAASVYCDSVQDTRISEEERQEIIRELEEPLRLERGFDPTWARDILLGIMAPYWIVHNKREETLQAALTQVEYMRDHVVPRLMARTPHDLRLCHEMRHKILASELKLRASLFRKESRGTHYREDYPYRNDEEFLGWVLQEKGEDGQVRTWLKPMPDIAPGDLPEDYFSRYVFYHYNELRHFGKSDSKTAWTLEESKDVGKDMNAGKEGRK